MKKILTITIMVLTTNFLFAQDGGNELKNFRFGLKVTPSVNWYKPEGKIMASNGAVMKFGGGLTLEFRLAKVISIQTGLQIDLDGGKIKYNNGGYTTPSSNTISYYYNTTDDEIATFGSRPTGATEAAAYDLEHTHLQLNERKFNVTYITLPLNLKMKTKEIGALTYFGIIGINNSFRWKARADDKVTGLDAANFGASDNKSKVDITKDLNIYCGSLNFGLGAEMNLAGSTSLTFGLNYNLGFTNVVKKESDYLERRSNNSANISTLSKMPQQIKSNAVVLTVGVLF